MCIKCVGDFFYRACHLRERFSRLHVTRLLSMLRANGFGTACQEVCQILTGKVSCGILLDRTKEGDCLAFLSQEINQWIS